MRRIHSDICQCTCIRHIDIFFSIQCTLLFQATEYKVDNILEIQIGSICLRDLNGQKCLISTKPENTLEKLPHELTSPKKDTKRSLEFPIRLKMYIHLQVYCLFDQFCRTWLQKGLKMAYFSSIVTKFLEKFTGFRSQIR